MFQSHLPKSFWGHSLLMATFIINRLPTKLLDWKTPFELLYKKKPNYEVFKTFGCLCYATNTKPNKDKFSPRAMKCIFLGYQLGHKGFKVYNL